jgi:iron complex transport system ATP-binding protein
MSAIFAGTDLWFHVRGTGGPRALVRDATLKLEPGEVVVVVGPNGAGKSSLIKLLTGELKPSSGSIESLGAPLASLPAWRLACRRTVMAQINRLSFPFAVHEVVRLGLEGLGRARSRATGEAMVEAALATADVLELAARDYQTLSGGEQQRVQFARALCQLSAGRSVEPVQALFLDEPIASLDLCHQIGLLDAARALAVDQSIAVLVILHDLNLAATYANRLVVMDQGRIVAEGMPADVLTPALLGAVFRVTMPMGAMPPPGLPFVLPQLCTLAAPG